MQRLRLQSKYDKDTNTFSKTEFELRESDKTISGKVSVTSKKGDEYVSKALPFVAFKSKISPETEAALRNSGGKTFEAEIGLMADSFEADGKNINFLKIVINEAKFNGEVSQHSVDKGNGFVAEEELSDEIPF